MICFRRNKSQSHLNIFLRENYLFFSHLTKKLVGTVKTVVWNEEIFFFLDFNIFRSKTLEKQYLHLLNVFGVSAGE